MNASIIVLGFLAWKEGKSVTWGVPLRKSFEFWRKCEEERGCGLIPACGTDRPTECYLGLNACVAWLLLTEYLERFTAILPLENVSLLPATTRDRWQYIRGQMEKKKILARYWSAMLDKKSFVFLRWNCVSKRNRRAVVWPRKILLSFGVNW